MKEMNIIEKYIITYVEFVRHGMILSIQMFQEGEIGNLMMI